MDLLLAPLLAGVILVEADEVAVVALVQRLVPGDRKAGLADLGERQVERALGADERRGEAHIEGEALGLELLPGGLGLVDALLAQVRIVPTGEKVLEVPFALSVADEHQQAVHVVSPSILLVSDGDRGDDRPPGGRKRGRILAQAQHVGHGVETGLSVAGP